MLDQQRRSIKNVLGYGLIPVAAAGIIVLVAPQLAFIALGVLIIGLIATGWIYHRKSSQYRWRYKSLVVPALVNLISPELAFDADGGIGADYFMHSELFRSRPDRYSTEDLLWGRYGETDLQMAEVHAESEHRDSDGDRSYSTIFKGILFIADFHKDFHGRTFLMPDVAERMFGGVGRALQGLVGRKNTDLLQMEDPEFEKAFAVHATDQVEGRYILSSSMMQRILAVRAKFGNSKIRVAFKDSAVWIAVPYKRNFLEASTGTTATDTTQIRFFLEEIKVFLDLVDELNLNTRIWTKE